MTTDLNRNDLGCLERVHRPAPEEFYDRFVATRRPVVVTGAMDGWAALHRWTADYLGATLGDRRIKVQRLDHDNVTRYELHTLEEVRFADFISAVSQEPPAKRYYLVIGNIHVVDNWPRRFAKPVFPELFSDIEILPLVDAERLLEVNLWVGYSGVVSNLHFDPIDNCLCMIRGRKHLRLYAPEEWSHMHLPSTFGLENPLHSPVNAMRPDLGRFPKFQQARYRTCTLEPGDVLYMPAGYWHHVRSEGFNVAVNLWWKDRRWALEQLRMPMRRATVWYLQDKARSLARRLWARPRAGAQT
jgi:[protein]-arginine 3-hydroxylase / protease